MKTLIICSSTYAGNTLQIARRIADKLHADLHEISGATPRQLPDPSGYDLIGLGSAIHFGAHSAPLLDLAATLPLQGKRVFIFSTRCRPFRGGYHRRLRKIVRERGATIAGEFSCRGFDRTGPWVIIDGCNKNRPDATDLFRAGLFADRLRHSLHPLAGIASAPVAGQIAGIPLREHGADRVAGRHTVFINTTACHRCGRCATLCPMGVISRSQGLMLPADERACILCRLCADHCPAQAIHINESAARGLRILLLDTFTTRLSRAYTLSSRRH